MHYFFRGLFSGNLKYWGLVFFFAIWFIALIDLATQLKPPGLFHGKLFLATLIITVVGSFTFLIGRSILAKQKRIKINRVKDEASWFEPAREREIRRLVELDPTFTTHCYECIYFNPDLLCCRRKMSADISHNRVKEIKINNIVYCLYWEKSRLIDTPESDSLSPI